MTNRFWNLLYNASLQSPKSACGSLHAATWAALHVLTAEVLTHGKLHRNKGKLASNLCDTSDCPSFEVFSDTW